MDSLVSPAKLNLFFKVLRRRSDGYHEIASLFQAVDLFDRLFFSFSKKDEISCTDPRIPLGKTNLVSKALFHFRQSASIPPVRIHIDKQIPIEAGLGGGSSNAATALWGLNRMAGFPLTVERLAEIGARIGSDVPFFFSLGTAYCRGRGEIVNPSILKEPLEGFIAKPFYGLATSVVYRNLILEELTSPDPSEALSRFPLFFNDLEGAAFRLEPRLAPLQDRLRSHFKTVTMTGSGTAFFCLEGAPPWIEGVSFFPFRSVCRLSSNVWY